MLSGLKRKLRKNTNQIELEYRISKGMHVGKNTHLYSVLTIDGAWPWLISIGDNVTISTNVTILAHDASSNVVGCGTKLGRVVIGNNVFIGTGSIILCDVKIGDNVVIGAGSLVTSDIPDNSVFVGRPARMLCSIEEYREKLRKLRETQPDFSGIHAWNEWSNAPEQDKVDMIQALEDGPGFV